MRCAFLIIAGALIVTIGIRAAEPVTALPAYTEKDLTEIARRAEGQWKNIEPDVKSSVREFFRFALDATVAGYHPERVERVFEMARKAQDKDPKSKTFGNFLWNWNDPAVIDRNSVQFCMQKGSLLWMFYREKLSEKARGQLEELIKYSVDGIRNHTVKPGYTNIFLMKIWNCVALGENTGRPDLAEEGYKLFDEWLAYTAKNGIREYLSPTYTGTDLESLSLLIKFSKKDEVRKKAEMALRFFWTDIAANWFVPAERLGGAHSRDYDYLTGHGLLDRWVQEAGWPTPSKEPGKLNPVVFDELAQWSPPREVLEKYGTVVPRFVWEHWGEKTEEWAAQYVGKKFSLGSAGSCYWNMDKMLTINWAGGPKIPTSQFFWDGRDDPYGKSKISESGAHSKALHLRPFAAAVQRGAEVLHISALDTDWKNIGHNKDEVKQLTVHWVLPTDVSVWTGDQEIKWPKRAEDSALPPDAPFFFRFQDVAIGVRFLWTRNVKDAPAKFVLSTDGEKYGAGRLTCVLADGKPSGRASVACFVRAAEGLDDRAFSGFRKAFAEVKGEASKDGQILSVRVAGLKGPMSLKINLEKQTNLAIEGGEPGVEKSLLWINGLDVGHEILKP
jgi:hypothetical protein